MQLQRLAGLDAEMKTAGVLRRQWDWKNGRGHFRVLYLLDVGDVFGPFPGITNSEGAAVYPRSVLHFVDANSLFSFHKLVSSGFRINERMDGDIGALFKALGIGKGTGGQPFSIKRFFEDFDAHIPGLASTWPPRVGDAPVPRNVPEPHKRYFLKIDTPNRGGTTEKNIRKTRALLGDKLADYCEERRVSSWWTDIPNNLTAEDIHRMIGL